METELSKRIRRRGRNANEIAFAEEKEADQYDIDEKLELFEILAQTNIGWREYKSYLESKEHCIDNHFSDGSSQSFVAHIVQSVGQRLPWLSIMMLLQSVSGDIVKLYSSLLSDHLTLAMYLTTLIGTGGSCGSQSIGLMIRMLTKKDRPSAFIKSSLLVVVKECAVGVFMAAILSLVLGLRVTQTHGYSTEVFVLSLSCFAVVFTSVIFGTLIPLVLDRIGLDPVGGATPLLTTLLDVGGVLTTMMLGNFFLR